MNQITPFVVFAINHPAGERFERALLRQLNLPHKAVQGVWKREHERSYVVPLTPENLIKVERIARKWNQEAIMIVRQTGEAVLLFLDGRGEQYLGRWQEVARTHAESLDGYTFDPETERYYAAI
jgi:hypothetical protein